MLNYNYNQFDGSELVRISYNDPRVRRDGNYFQRVLLHDDWMFVLYHHSSSYIEN